MFWTLVVFLLLFFVLSKFAFGPITTAVDAREKALRSAIDAAKARSRRLRPRCSPSTGADRGGARRGAEAHRRRPRARREDARRSPRADAARAAGRCSSARVATSRARRDRRDRRASREAVDLALAGASKVIEKNLETRKNRKLVEAIWRRWQREGQLMHEPTIARNYAEALLELAQRAGDLRGWGEMIDSVADAVETDRRCGVFLESPRVSAQRKNEMLQKAYGGALPRTSCGFSGAGEQPASDADPGSSPTSTTISWTGSRAACTRR